VKDCVNRRDQTTLNGIHYWDAGAHGISLDATWAAIRPELESCGPAANTHSRAGRGSPSRMPPSPPGAPSMRTIAPIQAAWTQLSRLSSPCPKAHPIRLSTPSPREPPQPSYRILFPDQASKLSDTA
jgi:hypothetical protein